MQRPCGAVGQQSYAAEIKLRAERKCGVSDPFVASVREQLLTVSSCDNGQAFEMNCH